MVSLRPWIFLLLPVLAQAQSVSVVATDAEATESGVYPGTFQFSRSGDTSAPLAISVGYSGNGRPGFDYETLPATIVIPAGQATADVLLDPINDPDVESGPDTVTATILPAAGYSVGSPASATITITDDETFTNTAPFLYRARSDSPTALTVFWTDNFETETKYRLQYRAEGTTAWSTIDNLPPGTTSRQVSGLTPGLAYEFRVAAFQGTTSSLIQNSLRAVSLAPDSPAPAFRSFEQWRIATGLGGPARASEGRTTDDPDSDGRTNLWEYLLGGNPLVPDSVGLTLTGSPAGLDLTWPENPDLSDATAALEESPTLASWSPSTLTSVSANGQRTAFDSRGGPARFYRLVATPSAPTEPSAIITCWGDSLTGNPGTYVDKLKVRLPGRTIQNCGIGGDTSIQIADRIRGLQITAPFPAVSADTPPGTPVRVVASRTTHTRLMSTSQRGNWSTYASTLANASRVEFFNLGHKIGESSTPLSASVTSNRTASASRLLAPGHPFSTGDVVHFPTGPLPSPLVAGKPYYVRDADSGGFALVEADTLFSITASSAAPSARFVSAGHPFADGNRVSFRKGGAPPGFLSEFPYFVRDADGGGFSLAESPGGTAVSTIYSATGNILGPPGAALPLAADFAGPTILRGPFVLNWTHPGGATSLTLRTHTDRDANTFIFWMGRNNSARPHEIYADLHAAVDQIKALNGRFLIVSVTNGGGESAGSPYYYNPVNLNALIRQEFPGEFVDLRSALLRAASSSVQDQTDRAADIPPGSLRSDNVHLNDAGQQLTADLLAEEITARGW